MFESPKKNANYRILTGTQGKRYQFFCDVSGAIVYTSAPVEQDIPENELKAAWEGEAKKCFNLCRRCGRWVSDAVYNVETLECVECSPWEDEPAFCPHCGTKVQSGEVFCSKCKKRLRYGMPVESRQA